MAPFSDIIGFPLRVNYRFRVSDVSYRLGEVGTDTVKLAFDALYLLKTESSPIVLRQLVRRSKYSGSPAALAHLIEMTPDRDLRLVAVWLLGLRGGTIGSKILAKFFPAADEPFRYVLAKAMWQMKAWHDLERLAKNDPSARVQRVAQHAPAVEFQTRLETYTSGIKVVKHHEPTIHQHFMARINFAESVQPKSATVIREILERIRTLVHGDQSTAALFIAFACFAT